MRIAEVNSLQEKKKKKRANIEQAKYKKQNE